MQLKNISAQVDQKTSLPVIPAGRRLRYYIHDHTHLFRIQLMGTLGGPEVAELDGCWRTAQSSVSGRKVRIDLSEVTAIDARGQVWLERMSGIANVEFTAPPHLAGQLRDETPAQIVEAPEQAKPCWRDRVRELFRTRRQTERDSLEPTTNPRAHSLAME